VTSIDHLASEVLERIEQLHPAVVVLSILPPVAQRETRLLWKRLRAKYPDLSVVIACWHSTDAPQLLGRIERDGPSRLVSNLAEAVVAAKAAEAKARLAVAS
jgi:hypothetical protein